jgi:hypothetical protein
MPMQFRKKPVVIEAVQFNESRESLHEIFRFAGSHVRNVTYGYLEIPTLEGAMRVSFGDWIIKGVKGEFYPCKPDIFAETYEMVDNSVI